MSIDKSKQGSKTASGVHSEKKIRKGASFENRLTSVSQRPYWVFAVFVFVIFIQSLFFDFTQYDDRGLIKGPELKLSNISLIFQKGVFHFAGELPPEQDIYYRPVQNLVYAAGNAIGRREPWIHHLISMVLHFAVAVQLFRFLLSIGYRHKLAFLATLIFFAHPLLVQAVAWIPGVGELLLTFFLLLSFHYLSKYLGNENINFVDCVLSNVFFLLALLSKENAVAFIPIILLYALLVHKNRQGIYRKLLAYGVVLIPCIALWLFLRHQALGQYGAIKPQALVTSLFDNAIILIYYVGKIFLPFNLSPLQALADSGLLTGIVCIILLAPSFFFFKKNRNITLLIFGLAWYLAFLIPTLFIPNTELLFYSYNHRLYLPLIGFFIALVEIFSLRGELTKINLAVASTVVLLFTVLSFSYARTFKDKYRFFETIVKNSPHSVKAYETLGNIYYEEKKCDRALSLYQKAAELRPETHGFYGLVGNTYANCYNDFPKAIEWYRKAMTVDSTAKAAANTAITLGNIYQMAYKDEAMAGYWFRRAVQIDSSQVFPMYTIGNMLFDKLPDSAAYWYRRVLALEPRSAVAQNGMGLIAYTQARYSEAITYFLAALQQDTANMELYKNLMLSYQLINDKQNTRRYAEEYKNRGGVIPQYTLNYLNSN